MKVLIIMGGFFPGEKYGGPPVSVDNFCTLMSGYDKYILTLNHDLFEKREYENIQYGWNDRGNSKVLYIKDSEYNKSYFCSIIKDIKPDVLYLQSLYQSCVLPCLQIAKKYRIKVLLAPRGELCSGALKLKKCKKLFYIWIINKLNLVKNIHFQSTSDEETKAIKKWMHADEKHIHRLDNIPSLPIQEYPRREKVAGEGKFLFLSRIHPKKNLLSAIKFFYAIEGNVVFDIYGPIENEIYWNECQNEIHKLPEQIKVKYRGIVPHEKIHEVVSQYDALLFPTLSENYGHVIAESLAVGTPVIISDQTPWGDLEINHAGWGIPLENTLKFKQCIERIIFNNGTEAEIQRNNVIKYAQKSMRLDCLKEMYLNTFKQISEEVL